MLSTKASVKITLFTREKIVLRPSWKKIHFFVFQLETCCAGIFNDADYEYHNGSCPKCLIFLNSADQSISTRYAPVPVNWVPVGLVGDLHFAPPPPELRTWDRVFGNDFLSLIEYPVFFPHVRRSLTKYFTGVWNERVVRSVSYPDWFQSTHWTVVVHFDQDLVRLGIPQSTSRDWDWCIPTYNV